MHTCATAVTMTIIDSLRYCYAVILKLSIPETLRGNPLILLMLQHDFLPILQA